MLGMGAGGIYGSAAAGAMYRNPWNYQQVKRLGCLSFVKVTTVRTKETAGTATKRSSN